MSQPLIVRRGDSGEDTEFISEIALAKTQQNHFVTAICPSNGRLKLISWRVNRDGSVSRLGDSGDEGEEISKLDIVRGRKTIVASSASSGQLRLTSWEIEKTGAIDRIGESGAQPEVASLIKLAKVTDTLFVTACRTDRDQLKLISWRLNRDGSLTRLGESDIPSLSVLEISLKGIEERGRLVVSVGTTRNFLKLFTLDVTSKGEITILGDSGYQAGKATIIRSVFHHPNLVTAVRGGNGRLKLISWRITKEGRTVTRLNDSGNQAGIIDDNALMSQPRKLISAVRTSVGTLKLISWYMTPEGVITRIGDSGLQAEEASLITLNQQAISRGAPIVTAMRVKTIERKDPISESLTHIEGYLKLITWKD